MNSEPSSLLPAWIWPRNNYLVKLCTQLIQDFTYSSLIAYRPNVNIVSNIIVLRDFPKHPPIVKWNVFLQSLLFPQHKQHNLYRRTWELNLGQFMKKCSSNTHNQQATLAQITQLLLLVVSPKDIRFTMTLLNIHEINEILYRPYDYESFFKCPNRRHRRSCNTRTSPCNF